MQHDFASVLLHLTEADDVRCKSWDQVHSDKRLVFTYLALEKDCTAAFNLGHRAISKLHRTLHLVVDLREHWALASHIISGAWVQYPPGTVTIHPITQLDKEFIFFEMHGWLLLGSNQFNDGGASHQQGWLLLLFNLCSVCLLILFFLSVFTSLMLALAAVAALITCDVTSWSATTATSVPAAATTSVAAATVGTAIAWATTPVATSPALVVARQRLLWAIWDAIARDL
jgi:hypothetical protein